MELMITTAVLSVVLSAICGVYLMIQTEWSRQRQKEDMRTAARQAVSDVAPYIKAAYSATVIKHFAKGDTLELVLPWDMAYGIYVPQSSSGRYRGMTSAPIFFGLSDSNGSNTSSGNILWAAYYDGTNVVGDPSWSLYPGTTQGRIAPIDSLSFSVDNTGFRPRVTMTVTTSCTINGTPEQFILSAVTSLRNSDN